MRQEDLDALVEKNKLTLKAMKKQTAVEWLVNELVKKGFPIEKHGIDLYDQAKAMEKEQIEWAYLQAYSDCELGRFSDSEKYYSKYE